MKVEAVELKEQSPERIKADLPIGSYVCFSVGDTGGGIEPSIISHIFDPFFTTRSAGQGTGLGLAAVMGTAINHDGAVTVESKMGLGSIFRIYIPEVEGPLAEHEEQEIQLPSVRGLRVLIVEDEPILRASTAMLLKDQGCEVNVADTGAQGVEIYSVNKDNIDVVLLDLIMPQMNGVEVYTRLKEINPDASVVMTSGYTDQQNIPDGVQFVGKPYRLARLMEALHEACGARKRRA